MLGLKRMADMTPIYKIQRTLERPPQTVRLPLNMPLSIHWRNANSTQSACCLTPPAPANQLITSRKAQDQPQACFANIIFLPPYRTILEKLVYLLIHLVQTFLQPVNMASDVPAPSKTARSANDSSLLLTFPRSGGVWYSGHPDSVPQHSLVPGLRDEQHLQNGQAHGHR